MPINSRRVGYTKTSNEERTGTFRTDTFIDRRSSNYASARYCTMNTAAETSHTTRKKYLKRVNNSQNSLMMRMHWITWMLRHRRFNWSGIIYVCWWWPLTSHFIIRNDKPRGTRPLLRLLNGNQHRLPSIGGSDLDRWPTNGSRIDSYLTCAT